MRTPIGGPVIEALPGCHRPSRNWYKRRSERRSLRCFVKNSWESWLTWPRKRPIIALENCAVYLHSIGQIVLLITLPFSLYSWAPLGGWRMPSVNNCAPFMVTLIDHQSEEGGYIFAVISESIFFENRKAVNQIRVTSRIRWYSTTE